MENNDRIYHNPAQNKAAIPSIFLSRDFPVAPGNPPGAAGPLSEQFCLWFLRFYDDYCYWKTACGPTAIA
jgi:hypothetical protein